MAYDGQVTVGGPPQTRQLPGLDVTKIAVGPYDNNCYLLRCRSTGATLLVDAANEAERLLELVGDRLDTILTTHQHQDHWQALDAVAAATGARTLAHPLDAEPLPVPPDELVEEGGTVEVGEVTLHAMHLTGHTPGSIALLYDEGDGSPHLFSGDCLFPGGVGNTFGSKENFDSLLHDVETKIFARLPDSTWVYPGHGGDTTLGAERPHLEEWRARGW